MLNFKKVLAHKIGEFEYTKDKGSYHVEGMGRQMAEGYYKTRVDSFLTKTDIKPRDHKPFGHTDQVREEGRQKLLEAAKKKRKFVV